MNAPVTWGSQSTQRQPRQPLDPQLVRALAASATRWREVLIERGFIVPAEARSELDHNGLTHFRNAFGEPVFAQGNLTRQQIEAPPPIWKDEENDY